MTVTKDMLIVDAIRSGKNQEAMAEVLFSIGMHCLGCAMANNETIEEAAAVHGVDPDELCERLTEASEM